MTQAIPIITLDGPSGSGKGSVGCRVAETLGWHFLDSGALYRLLALSTIRAGLDAQNESALCALALSLDIGFHAVSKEVYLAGEPVTLLIRSEDCSQMASQVAALGRVRAALLERQRAFAKEPGLVADGRDMGSVVFPEARYKFFLEASLQVRVQRRYLQLKATGQNVSLEDLWQQMKMRDERDRTRADAPLLPAKGAVVLDTTDLGVEAVCAQILRQVHQHSANGTH